MHAVTNPPRLLGQGASVNLVRSGLRPAITVCRSTKAAFNFAPASDRDETVHGCCMPGFGDPLPGAGAVGPPETASWADFMRIKGVGEVRIASCWHCRAKYEECLATLQCTLLNHAISQLAAHCLPKQMHTHLECTFRRALPVLARS